MTASTLTGFELKLSADLPSIHPALKELIRGSAGLYLVGRTGKLLAASGEGEDHEDD
jgi:hypothetical protein